MARKQDEWPETLIKEVQNFPGGEGLSSCASWSWVSTIVIHSLVYTCYPVITTNSILLHSEVPWFGNHLILIFMQNRMYDRDWNWHFYIQLETFKSYNLCKKLNQKKKSSMNSDENEAKKKKMSPSLRWRLVSQPPNNWLSLVCLYLHHGFWHSTLVYTRKVETYTNLVTCQWTPTGCYNLAKWM
jgi:hypothetical protein